MKTATRGGGTWCGINLFDDSVLVGHSLREIRGGVLQMVREFFTGFSSGQGDEPHVGQHVRGALSAPSQRGASENVDGIRGIMAYFYHYHSPARTTAGDPAKASSQ